MSVTNNALQAIGILEEELTTLNRKNPKDFSTRDGARAKQIGREIDRLSFGLDRDELRNFQLNRTLREAGFKELPRNVSGSVELREQWIRFIKHGGDDFGGVEVRADSQQWSQWGRTSGLTFTDYLGDGLGTQGGVLVPADYDKRLFQSAAAIDGIVSDGNCSVLRTPGAGACTTPAIDDCANSSPAAPTRAVRIGEATKGQYPTTGGAGASFDAILWGAVPTYRAGIVYAAIELDDDSAFSLGMVMEKIFARRFALAFGADMITGSGAIQSNGTPGAPLGLTTSLPASTAITSATSTLALSDLENCYFQLGYQYRGSAKWYMSDATRLVVSKLVSTANRNANYSDSFETLFNREIVCCNSMNGPTAGSQSVICFMHPDYFLRREVIGGQFIRRFVESEGAAEAGLIGFQGYARLDARPLLFESCLPPVASLSIHS